jgi:hypothetical protein
MKILISLSSRSQAWFDGLTKKAQKEYLADHPTSKFGTKIASKKTLVKSKAQTISKYANLPASKLADRYKTHPKRDDFWLYERHVKNAVKDGSIPSPEDIWKLRITGTTVKDKISASNRDLIDFLIHYHSKGGSDSARSDLSNSKKAGITATLAKLQKEKREYNQEEKR